MPERVLLPDTPVLRADGRPNPGYSVGAAARYDRRRVPLGCIRRKEWDFYQVYDGRYALQLVIGHVSYAGQAALNLLDTQEGRPVFRKGLLTPFALGIPRLAASAADASDVVIEKKGVRLRFCVCPDGTRRLVAAWDDVRANLTLGRPLPASVTVNTPFPGRPFAFYYNHKCGGMPVSGTVETPGGRYIFSPDKAFALLDFGRGALPFRHEWLWSAASWMSGGTRMGFNLGCFGDNACGTENIVCIGDAYEKLGQVTFTRGASYLDPWRIRDTAGRLELTLLPRFDNDTATKAAFVNNRCHQVFGTFSGTLRRADGSTLRIEGAPGFAEHAVNRW